jgi:hypothetical protein
VVAHLATPVLLLGTELLIKVRLVGLVLVRGSPVVVVEGGHLLSAVLPLPALPVRVVLVSLQPSQVVLSLGLVAVVVVLILELLGLVEPVGVVLVVLVAPV